MYPPLRGEDFADMRPRFDQSAIVKGLIGDSSLVGIVGPSGSGKTFFSNDLACHAALGPTWRGRKVATGLVVYGALEGAAGARNRFYAWRLRNLPADKAGLPLRAMTDAVNLRDVESVQRMIAFVQGAESAHGEKVTLVFIDTLSRAMAGGNENNSDDMGLLIRGADSIRQVTGAAVVLVHHLGKDETRGARGHNSFFAALDTEITIRVNGDQRTAVVTKQRDWPSGAEFPFRLEPIEIGRDADGDAVTSCVVSPLEETFATRQTPTGKNQTALLAGLTEWRRTHPNLDLISTIELQALAASLSIDRKRLPEATKGLTDAGWLRSATGGYRLSGEAYP